MLSCHNNKGFQLTFANGWTISILIGTTNHCEQRGKPINPINHYSQDAEVIAIDANGHYWSKSGGDCLTRQSADEVLALMNEVAAYPLSVKHDDAQVVS